MTLCRGCGLKSILNFEGGNLKTLISILTSRFQIVWFSSFKGILRYIIGCILGMGCTLGQGIAGTSTLSLGLFLDLFALMLGAYIGIRMQKRFMTDHEAPRAD